MPIKISEKSIREKCRQKCISKEANKIAIKSHLNDSLE